GRELLAEALDHQRQRERARHRQLAVDDALFAHASQHLAQALDVELLAQHLALGLAEQAVVGVVLAKDLVEERARRLQLPRRLRLAPKALADEARDASDLAEAPARELARVQAREHVVQQVVLLEQALVDERRRVDRPGREQLEAVIIDDDRERVGPILREPPGEQAAEADVGIPARERIQEQVLALARLEPLDQ